MISWKSIIIDYSSIENASWICSWASPTMVVFRESIFGGKGFSLWEDSWMGDHIFNDLYTPKKYLNKRIIFKLVREINFPFTPWINSTSAASCRQSAMKAVTGCRGIDRPFVISVVGHLSKYLLETWQSNVHINETFLTGRWVTNDQSLGQSIDTA